MSGATLLVADGVVEDEAVTAGAATDAVAEGMAVAAGSAVFAIGVSVGGAGAIAALDVADGGGPVLVVTTFHAKTPAARIAPNASPINT